MMPVRLESAAPQGQVKHSTTEPLLSLSCPIMIVFYANTKDVDQPVHLQSEQHLYLLSEEKETATFASIKMSSFQHFCNLADGF